jgi:hypothetical protein
VEWLVSPGSPVELAERMRDGRPYYAFRHFTGHDPEPFFNRIDPEQTSTQHSVESGEELRAKQRSC